MTSTSIYILRLQGGYYYIGKSDNPMKRYEEHLRGQGSSWTKLHKPELCERVISSASAFDEDKYTKEYMAKYGIDKVRGGTYVETELSQKQIDCLQKEIWAAQDKCTRCGHHGHFVDACFATINVNGCKIENICRVKNIHVTTNKSTYIPSVRTSNYAISYYPNLCSVFSKKTNACFKCGRAGHYASDCYANTYKKTYSRYRGYDSDSD